MQIHLYENEVTKSLGTVYRLRYYWLNVSQPSLLIHGGIRIESQLVRIIYCLVVQSVMIADPLLQQEVFELERSGAVEKPSFTVRWNSVKVRFTLACGVL